jgi:hypothetical protein
MELRIGKRRAARARPMTECAQCGNPIYVPEWSDYLDSNRARHLWVCDACGYTFESTVRFSGAAE